MNDGVMMRGILNMEPINGISFKRHESFFNGAEVVVPFLSHVIQILCIMCMKVLLNFGNLVGESTLMLSVLR